MLTYSKIFLSIISSRALYPMRESDEHLHSYMIMHPELTQWICTPRKQFLWYTVKEQISLHWRKFCWFKKIFFNLNKSISWDQRNFFELTKLSLIQRNLFFDRISKKCFFDSKKLFSQSNCFSTMILWACLKNISLNTNPS